MANVSVTLGDSETIIDLSFGPLRLLSWTSSPSSQNVAQLVMPYGVQIKTAGYQPVTETMIVGVTWDSTQAREQLGILNDVLAKASRWHDDAVYIDVVWLTVTVAGEGTRRAMVCGGAWQWKENPRHSQCLTTTIQPAACSAGCHALAVVGRRHNITAPDPLSAPRAISAFGGSIIISAGSGYTLGELPSRIETMTISGSDTNTNPLTRFWLASGPTTRVSATLCRYGNVRTRRSWG